MDIVAASAKQSSLYQALTTQNVDKDAVSLKLKPAIPAHFREAISLLPETGVKLTADGGDCVWSFPRSGLLDSCFVRLLYKGASLGADGAKEILFSKNPAAYIESICLRSHSRKLIEVPGDCLDILIRQSRHAGSYMTLMDKTDHSKGVGKTDELGFSSDLGVPILIKVPMSFFDAADGANPLVTQFCESLQLQIKVRPVIKSVQVGHTSDTRPTAIHPSLLVGSKNLYPEQYRSFVKTSYLPGKSAQALVSSPILLGSATGKGPDTPAWQIVEFGPIASTQSGVARAYFVTVMPSSWTDSNTAWGDQVYQPAVHSVRMEASGRTIFDLRSDEAHALTINTTRGGGAYFQDKNCFFLSMAQDSQDDSYMSGAVATAGMSSMRFMIKCKVYNNPPLTCRVYAIEHRVISVASDSGAVTGALST